MATEQEQAMEYVMRTRVAKLDALADAWPMRCEVRTTRDLTAISGPPAGTTQTHLACDRDRCGQTIYVMSSGGTKYQVSPYAIRQLTRAHIAQCHQEALTSG
jgi:hypothetical protein